mgnify:CR=1 FL=1
MSKDVRSIPYKPFSQARIDRILQNNPSVTGQNTRPVLVGCREYDTLHPEETIQNFCMAAREMISRYEYDREQYAELENEMQDLLHYVEISADKNANAGFKLYKRLAEVRRERRACKNEMDLLQPIYDTFHNTGIINKLSELQGKCRNNKQLIDSREYTVRTDILNDLC